MLYVYFKAYPSVGSAKPLAISAVPAKKRMCHRLDLAYVYWLSDILSEQGATPLLILLDMCVAFAFHNASLQTPKHVHC